MYFHSEEITNQINTDTIKSQYPMIYKVSSNSKRNSNQFYMIFSCYFIRFFKKKQQVYEN